MTSTTLIVIPDQTKRNLSIQILSKCSEIVGSGSRLADAYLSTPQAPFANIIVVDLMSKELEQSSYWIALHVTMPSVIIIAVTGPTFSPAALLAALHAGVFCFIQWSDPASIWCDAVLAAGNGRRFYSAHWMIVSASLLVRDLETSQSEEEKISKQKHFLQSLSRLDYAILAYLIQNNDRLVTTDELLKQVWKHDFSEGGTVHQVRSGIKRLRRKIDDDRHDHYHIRTVHGQGYILTIS